VERLGLPASFDLPVRDRMMAPLYDESSTMLGRGGQEFTAEQADAIARREGPLLLAANAGSGKTSVFAERYVRMVVEDGLRPDQILAITFTDKAAGELRHRIRSRFLELGEGGRARELEGAWISTFHGFCARVLRARAIPAGLDPGFVVLDEPRAREIRNAAWESALAGFLEGTGPEPRSAALDLVAAYGADQIADIVRSTHDALRSTGQIRPVLPALPAVPSAEAALAAVEAARGPALAEIGTATGKTVDKARAALEACREVKAGNAGALKGPGCTAYIDAHRRWREAVADAKAVEALGLLDELMGRYADAYANAKRSESALDFDDLQLLVVGLFDSSPDIAAAYAERFERIMVDEFQDTNRVQLDLLDALDRGHTFVVGDELQSIYGFRHADVEIFRARRQALDAQAATATLATNFRSRAEILQVLDDAFGWLHGEHHVPFVAGRTDAQPQGEPVVELLLTETAGWDAPEVPDVAGVLPSASRWRQAEARLVAQRVAELAGTEGVSAADIVVLLRSAGDMALYERAIEEHGITTLAAGGRGYWGRQQVLDLCAYLGTLANPRDEEALFGVLASPLVGLSSDGLALLAIAAPQGRRWDAVQRELGADVDGGDARLAGLPGADRERLAAFHSWFCAERAAAPRLALDELIERVVARTGYDLHVLGLPGGRRRLANVQKLQRLAAAFEARAGRDVRGLIDLATAELEAEAREPDAPVELGDEPAVRLMTIHAAKGLEFPVVVVADLGRKGSSGTPDLIVRADRVALRVASLHEKKAPALGFAALREELAASDDAEERRVFHVAMTRARERLILSGACDLTELKEHTPGAPPILWIAPPLLDDERVRVTRSTPDSVGAVLREESIAPAAVATLAVEGVGRPSAAPPAPPPSPVDEPLQLALDVGGAPQAATTASAAPAAPPPGVGSLSFSGLSFYAECPYRWYLRRVLQLPEQDPGADAAAAPPPAGLDPLVRGSIVHELLEELDLHAPVVPDTDAIVAMGAQHEADLDPEQVEDVRALVAAFVGGPLAGRLAAARPIHKEHAFTLAVADHEPLLNGVVDVLAVESDGTALVLDYKTNPVEGVDLDALVDSSYGLQRTMYALAALRAGSPAVEVAYLFLGRPREPVARRYDPADIPALEDEVRAASRGLRAGEFPVTRRPHRALCLTCPGRRGLCSWDAAAQLRETAEAV
jgi:ATP-dependent exoDNAse (exonuclease V) beta subunit